MAPENTPSVAEFPVIGTNSAYRPSFLCSRILTGTQPYIAYRYIEYSRGGEWWLLLPGATYVRL